ncbi:zinc finger, CCHC-type containing protein [Tanacetum coccineum]
MAEDASSKKFIVSNFTNYKMTDSRTVMEQYNELFGILGRFTQHKMNMDKAIQVSCIIDKLPPWKDFKHNLKHNKEELTLVELSSHLRIEELNIVNDIGNSSFMSTFKLNDSILWHARLGHVHFKRMQDISKDGLIPALDMDTEKWNKKYFMIFIDDASSYKLQQDDLEGVMEIEHKGIRDRKKYRADLKCQFKLVDIKTANKMILRHCTGRTRALEQETRDLDMAHKQMKMLKAIYGVTSPQELRRNQD